MSRDTKIFCLIAVCAIMLAAVSSHFLSPRPIVHTASYSALNLATDLGGSTWYVRQPTVSEMASIGISEVTPDEMAMEMGKAVSAILAKLGIHAKVTPYVYGGNTIGYLVGQ